MEFLAVQLMEFSTRLRSVTGVWPARETEEGLARIRHSTNWETT